MSTEIIRPFHPADAPHLLDICLKTGDNGKDGTRLYSDPWFIGQLYVMPYITYDPDLCLVIVDQEVPKGYVLGASHTGNFYRWMEDFYLPPLRMHYPQTMRCSSDTEQFFLARLHSDKSAVPVTREHPAHLHINLLPEIQGRGYGSELINQFIKQLRHMDVPGVYLHTGTNNSAAVRFYRKQGFSILEENRSSVKMGKRLDS
ncbi:GNAT family N-acetyltransferase [Salinispira pacifica]|uniref:Acetyltransferase n=1 Tax=Salinispira pacifica TaxID=1307761 RepID=V5WLE0_9SPIO|nr:GNAT family N-acetyltransferase [Salinispira pacifica]AHC16677.1 Acetyltransferase [Salinispira pacifica]